MAYLIEKNLFLSKVEGTIQQRSDEGYKLHSMIPTQTVEETRNGNKAYEVSKATLIFEKTK